MISYIEFKQTTVTDKIKEQFLRQATGMKLGKIITQSTKTIRMSFHQTNNLPNVYLIMIVGSNDNTLINLAKKYGFPRGFPVIWIPDVSMQYFGFYPKFSNDERQTVDNLSEINTVTKIGFFRKWSGFLSQVISFRLNGQIFWTITSKNSADCNSPFVRDAKRLFDPFMTNQLINLMTKQQLHFCAEIMSKNDQTHGSRVFVESPVITAVGHGKFYDLGITNSDSDKLFVKFFTNQELVLFCQENNLPCDSAISIDDRDAARNFLIELSKQRDFMTDSTFEILVNNFATDVGITCGTVTHSQILGDCLEGLVIRIHKTNGSSEVKKYKFANYTVRTMLLRKEFEKFIFDYGLIERTNNFVNYWCVSTAGQEYWTNFALECFMEYENFIPIENDVGVHIQLAEFVHNRIDKNAVFSDVIEKFNQKITGRSSNTIVICLGPIGSGKTTFANKLAASDPRFMVIDGDILDLDMQTVMKLGKERNDYTRWKIIEAIMIGKIPIVSCGGGVLFSVGKNQLFNLPQQIMSTLRIYCKIIVCIPSNINTVSIVDKNYDIEAIYKCQDLVKNTVIRRIKSGEWSLDKKFLTGKTSERMACSNFAAFIARKSEENAKFAKKIVLAADNVFAFPLITNDNYGIQNNFDFSAIVSILSSGSKPPNGTFRQIRLLTKVNDEVGHITWKYDINNGIVFSLNDFDDLEQKYPSVIPGIYQKITSLDGKLAYTFVVPKNAIYPDDSIHITINCGNHAPKETINIVQAIKAGNLTVSIPDKSNKNIIYDLTKIMSDPCQINILGAFGI
jgi:hypothetical protein